MYLSKKQKPQINQYENSLIGKVSNIINSETPSEKLERHLRLHSQFTQSEINIINKWR